MKTTNRQGLATMIAGLGFGLLPTLGSAHVISEADHHAFEHKYAEMCVKAEQHNPQRQIKSDQKIGELCECMAREISKHLSKSDVEHFLKKNEFPMDLVIKNDAAAYTCVQAKP